ncbi:hypothetical protein BDV18DRAFT_163577 [Aspergillus unguis]
MDLEKEHQAALFSLDEHHLAPLRDAVQHIFFTQRAEYIFAQVAEGLPTRDTSIFKHDIDPEIAERVEPGQEAIDLVRSWWADFHLEHLEISSSTLRAYNDTRLGTKLRLIEAIAIVIHTLAALLFEHTNQAPYKRPAQQQKFIFVNGKPELCDEWIDSPFPTYLYHNDYVDYDIYAMGIADVVAYWAETHLFGGVVVFYHGPSNTEFLDVLLHPDSDFKAFMESPRYRLLFQLKPSGMLPGFFLNSPYSNISIAVKMTAECRRFREAGIQDTEWMMSLSYWMSLRSIAMVNLILTYNEIEMVMPLAYWLVAQYK